MWGDLSFVDLKKYQCDIIKYVFYFYLFMIDIRSGAAGKNATSNTVLENNLFKEEMPSDVSHHTIEHDTYEMYREYFRKFVEKKEKERDELRRTEEQRSREKTLRIREDPKNHRRRTKKES